MTNCSQSLIYMFVVVHVLIELPDLLLKVEALSGALEGPPCGTAAATAAGTAAATVTQNQVKNLCTVSYTFLKIYL